MKMVIYSSMGDYAVTTLKNYEAYIQDVRKIHRFKKAEWTIEELIDYYCKYFSVTVNDFIIIK